MSFIYPYSFKMMEQQLSALIKKYPFLSLSSIGKSIEKRDIYCLRLGQGDRKIHVNASHHANEWITSIVIIQSIQIICNLIQKQTKYLDIDCTTLLDKVSYDFVPMVNPDGVELCLNSPYQSSDISSELLRLNEGKLDFSKWKANIRGVDLNRNYNAGFEIYKKNSQKQSPSYAYYPGKHFESEPESFALANLTRQRKYDIVFAYHTQGKVIYWTYQDLYIDYAKEYATMFSKLSQYLLDDPEIGASYGGYKDWFISSFKKPGFTIECGLGENPIELSQIPTIIHDTLPILILASKDLRKEDYELGDLQ